MKESGRSRLGLLASAIVLAGISLLIFSLLPDQTEYVDRDLPPPFAGWITRSTGLSLLPPPTPLADSPILTFAATLYRHPSGAFSVRYPDGWQIDEAEDAALFTAPDDTAQFSIAFTLLDSSAIPSFPALAESELRAAWGDLPSFTISQIESPSTSDRWISSFTFDQPLPPDGAPARVTALAIFQMQDGVLFNETFLAQADLQNRIATPFQAIADSLVIDSQAAILSDSE